MDKLEHLSLGVDELELINIAAKINAIINIVNDLQEIVYDFTGHTKP